MATMFRSVIRSVIQKIQKPRIRKPLCAALRAVSTCQKRCVQKPLEYLEEEKRFANDGRSYTKSEFQDYYWDSWQLKWDAASPTDKAQERILSLEKRILSLETEVRKRDAKAPVVNRKRMVPDVLHGMAPSETYTSVQHGRAYRCQVIDGRDVEEGGQGEKETEYSKYVQKRLSSNTSVTAELLTNKSNQEVFKAGTVAGNIYRYWGFGRMKRQRTAFAGQVLVMLIQLTAPVAMFIWNLYALNLNKWGISYSIGFDHLLYKHRSMENGVSNIAKNFLIFSFVLAFMLNAVQWNYEDARNWQKSVLLKKLLENSDDEKKQEIVANAKPIWFILGPIINCQCLLFCCIDTYLLMYTSVDNVSDVVMNVLAVFFLYKMDDIGCDLNFFDEDDWHPNLMGQLLDQVALEEDETGAQSYLDETKPEWYLLWLTVLKFTPREARKLEVDPPTCCDLMSEMDDMDDNEAKMIQAPHPCHFFTTMILWLFVFLLPVTFIFINGITVAAEQYEIQELKDKLLELSVVVP